MQAGTKKVTIQGDVSKESVGFCLTTFCHRAKNHASKTSVFLMWQVEVGWGWVDYIITSCGSSCQLWFLMLRYSLAYRISNFALDSIPLTCLENFQLRSWFYTTDLPEEFPTTSFKSQSENVLDLPKGAFTSWTSWSPNVGTFLNLLQGFIFQSFNINSGKSLTFPRVSISRWGRPWSSYWGDAGRGKLNN